MTQTARETVLAHWAAANARDWPRFAALLAPELAYTVPQTRERIDGGAGYLDMFATWPGDWRAVVQSLVCEGDEAVCRIAFEVDGQTMTGISFFTVTGGRIVRVVDYWPEPYEPPPRASRHLVRDPAPPAQ